jgi:hypothetical protein
MKQNFRVITKVLSAENPKDNYYYNKEELLRYYFVVLLFGLLMFGMYLFW